MPKSIRKRYFMNNHMTPAHVAIETKAFEMYALYQGVRKLPAEDFVHEEVHVSFHFGYNCFDIDATAEVHKEFQEKLSGNIHATSVLVLTEVEGEIKWEATKPIVLS